jgi:hypothetical protein
MKIYQHKYTKVLMSENDYNHLSTREKNEMVLYDETFNTNEK